MKEQIAPINPFDSPPHADDGMKELSETSIRLEEFQNEAFGGVKHNNSDDIPIQQSSTEVIINNDIMVDDNLDNKNRDTTSTKDTYDENNISNYINQEDNAVILTTTPDIDEQSSISNNTLLNNKCCFYFLRIIHRICHPHIHPPCLLLQRRHPKCCCCSCIDRISPRHRRIICRSIIITFMIITITFTLLDLLILHKYLHVWLDDTLAWLQLHPVSGGLAFIGIFLLASLCFFPVALLSLGAGFVYIELDGLGLGIFVAFIVTYIGCLLGAAVCFARSRYLMRQLIERFSVRYPIVRAVDKAFETMGFRLFLLLRLSPAMPFNALVSNVSDLYKSLSGCAQCLFLYTELYWRNHSYQL